MSTKRKNEQKQLVIGSSGSGGSNDSLVLNNAQSNAMHNPSGRPSEVADNPIYYLDFSLGSCPRMAVSPLPFPSCKANDIACLRRGFRTFFFLMDSGHLDMRPVDPIIVNSVGVSLPEQQVTFLMRRVNVTGAKWTKLAARRFDLNSGKSGVIFSNDLHLAGEIIMTVANRTEPPLSAYITMDIQEVESNITYSWSGANLNNEDYILIGPERIEVRNRRTPTYFLQPNNANTNAIHAALQMMPSVLDHFSNEIVTSLMHSIVDNFRLFARKIPVKYYYNYNSFLQ